MADYAALIRPTGCSPVLSGELKGPQYHVLFWNSCFQNRSLRYVSANIVKKICNCNDLSPAQLRVANR